METKTSRTVVTSTPIEGQKVAYTGMVTVTGGRDGIAKSSDGRLEVALTSPGAKGTGTNPEQLFAAGWSACFIGAMQFNAQQQGTILPSNLSVDAAVDLATNASGFILQAKLQINLPGLDIDTAHAIVTLAHATCPYSKATAGNINVQLDITV